MILYIQLENKEIFPKSERKIDTYSKPTYLPQGISRVAKK